MRITTAYLGELGLDSFKGENKMGRPIRKDKLVSGANDFGGNLSGKIAVTAYRPSGGAVGSTKYTLGTEGDDEGKAGAGIGNIDVITDQ